MLHKYSCSFLYGDILHSLASPSIYIRDVFIPAFLLIVNHLLANGSSFGVSPIKHNIFSGYQDMEWRHKNDAKVVSVLCGKTSCLLSFLSLFHRISCTKRTMLCHIFGLLIHELIFEGRMVVVVVVQLPPYFLVQWERPLLFRVKNRQQSSGFF